MKNESLVNKIEWDILEQPIHVENAIMTGKKKAIVRSDNNKVLAVVGSNYKPVYNRALLDIANRISDYGEFELEGFREYNEGKVIHCLLQNNSPYLNFNGHMVREKMGFSNSHDGSKRFSVFTYTAMERCGNIYADHLHIFSKKHIGDMNFDSYEIKQLILNYKSKKDVIYQSFEGMDKVNIDEEVVDKLMAEVYQIISKDIKKPGSNEWKKSPSMLKLNSAINDEMYSLGNNLFGLFNGVTWYTSHEMRNADCGLGKLSGTAHAINQKAFQYCNKLKQKQELTNA